MSASPSSWSSPDTGDTEAAQRLKGDFCKARTFQDSGLGLIFTLFLMKYFTRGSVTLKASRMALLCGTHCESRCQILLITWYQKSSLHTTKDWQAQAILKAEPDVLYLPFLLQYFPSVTFLCEKKTHRFIQWGCWARDCCFLYYHTAQWDFLQVIAPILMYFQSETLVGRIRKYLPHMTACGLYIWDQISWDTRRTKKNMNMCKHTRTKNFFCFAAGIFLVPASICWAACMKKKPEGWRKGCIVSFS